LTHPASPKRKGVIMNAIELARHLNKGGIRATVALGGQPGKISGTEMKALLRHNQAVVVQPITDLDSPIVFISEYNALKFLLGETKKKGVKK